MDVNHISSSFLPNFESFINTTPLEELENITNSSLIAELEDGWNPKLQFLNQGENSKELIFFFLLKTMEEVQKHYLEYMGDLSAELIKIFNHFSHLRIKWVVNTDKNMISAELNYGDKRQLSVKTRGTYYTPHFMSEFMVAEAIRHISREKFRVINDILLKINKSNQKQSLEKLINTVPLRIIDVSMGIGNFLCGAIPFLISYLKKCKKILQNLLFPKMDKLNVQRICNLINFCLNVSKKEENTLIGHYIVNNCIYGIEMDEKIYRMAQIIISLKINSIINLPPRNISHLICKNTILTSQKEPEDNNIKIKIYRRKGFIWSKQFPEVFTRDKAHSGFNLVIGNPPWEILKPNDREFFSNYCKDFIKLERLQQDNIRKQLLNNTSVAEAYEGYSNRITLETNLISNLSYSHQSSFIQGRIYTGDPQLYKYFLEIAFKIVSNNGIISLIVQHNFLGSKSCANLRSLYLNNGKFLGIWEFSNLTDNYTIFENVDPNQKLILFLFQKLSGQKSEVLYKKCSSNEELTSKFKSFEVISPHLYHNLSGEELQIFGFANKRQRIVFEKIMNTNHNLEKLNWKNKEIILNFSQDLHVTRHRDKFSQNSTMISIFGGRNFGPYYFHGKSRRFLKEDQQSSLILPQYSIICRNILPNSAKRIIFSIPPKDVAVDNSCTRISLKSADDKELLYFLLALSNSFLVEFFIRIILTGINLNYYLINRIPVPSRLILTNPKYSKIISEIVQLSKELICTPPETERWATIFSKVEAMIAILFELSKNEVLVILDSYDFLKLQTMRLSGHRPMKKITKTLIIQYYDSISSRLT
ncbi:MAG: hypothetical protein JW776_10140 [Candidatus Lokiarchaeota archaeon]|nr:hypothetical protein [Candidatus Lokiarchaeota archaeon]